MQGFKKEKRKDALEVKNRLKKYYMNKYFDVIINKFSIDLLTPVEKHYIFTKLFNLGKIGAFKDKYEGEVFFVDFAPTLLGFYGQPKTAKAINEWGAKFVPQNDLEVEKDIAVGYILPNHLSIWDMIEPHVDKIIQYEMLLRSNINALKMPYLLAGSDDNKEKLRILFDNIVTDQEELYLTTDDVNAIKVFNSGVPFNLDKIEQLKLDEENKIKELLGIDSANYKKAEYINKDDVNSNNQAINNSNDKMLECLTNFFEMVNRLFGTEFVVELNEVIVDTADEQESTPGDKTEDDL